MAVIFVSRAAVESISPPSDGRPKSVVYLRFRAFHLMCEDAAAKACIEHSYSNLKPTKIIAGCHLQNEASKRVLQKIGFSFVGNK